MSKVFCSVTMSLDGFLAPESRADDPGDKRWLVQWMELQQYVFEQSFFRENLELGEGGLTGEDNRILEETFHRTGAAPGKPRTARTSGSPAAPTPSAST